MKAWLALMVVGAVVMAGCGKSGSGGGRGDDADNDVPPELRGEDIDRVVNLALENPYAFAFPGQERTEPLTILIEDTIEQGQGVTAMEWPDDSQDGILGYGRDIEAFPLDEHVPEGQPVELRMKLKWGGNPGASGDLDIYVNVPGTNDAREPNRFDESFNWNKITKERVVNTIRIEGEPFEVGVELGHGRTYVDGFDYTIEVQIFYGHNVLAPGVAYGIQVPDEARIIEFESEPLAGPEHITSEILVIDPRDELVEHFIHNDIHTETRGVPVTGGGEYVVYARSMHGGFLRVETDVPNANFTARILPTTTTITEVHSGGPAPGTWEEMCVPDPPNPVLVGVGPQCGLGTANQWGGGDTFDLSSTFPLDVFGAVVVPGATTGAAINITSPLGHVGTWWTWPMHEDAEGNRIGWEKHSSTTSGTLAKGTYTYGYADNGPGGATISYGVTTYER